MHPNLKRYAMSGIEIGIVESMEMALEYSANDPDSSHPEWSMNLLRRCVEGEWAEPPHADDPIKNFSTRNVYDWMCYT